jgi:hypothetical protein
MLSRIFMIEPQEGDTWIKPTGEFSADVFRLEAGKWAFVRSVPGPVYECWARKIVLEGNGLDSLIGTAHITPSEPPQPSQTQSEPAGAPPCE